MVNVLKACVAWPLLLAATAAILIVGKVFKLADGEWDAPPT